jgi:two-component system, sensor histidine kinase PdtaS
VTKPALRRTGVNALGDMAWGSHVCMFYESKEDLLDTIVPYSTAGLESKEFCQASGAHCLG